MRGGIEGDSSCCERNQADTQDFVVDRVKPRRFKVERDELDAPKIYSTIRKRGSKIVVQGARRCVTKKAAAAEIESEKSLEHLRSDKPACRITLLERLLHRRNNSEGFFQVASLQRGQFPRGDEVVGRFTGAQLLCLMPDA